MKVLDKLKLFENILSKANTAKNSNDILNYVMDQCIKITGALTGSIMLINPESNILEIKVFRGLKKERVIDTKLNVGEGVTGKVAQTGKPILIKNADSVDFYIRIRRDLKSELAVPLILDGKVIGVISVDSNKEASFTEKDLAFLKDISNFTSQILFKEKLIDDLKERIGNQSLLLKISNILEEGINLDNIFEKIMKIISSNINIKRGMIVLLNQATQLKIFAGYKLSEDAIQRGVYQIGEGITGKVVKYGKSICIKDISKNKEFLNKMKIRRGNKEINSFFAFPIKYSNKTLGVLGIEKGYINEKDFKNTIDMLTIISSLISNKVHNYEMLEKEKEVLLKRNLELKEKLMEKESDVIFIGKNKKVSDILETVNIIADTDATVLITGDTGTGKEVLAKMVHYKSERWDKPFISVNCAAIPENLLESELFGYKKGAFTGATTDKKGKFLLANKGTIFLDEIGDLNLSLQSKMLRVLQEKIVEPLGSEKSYKVDVRIISATNKNLSDMVKEKKFREDLFYRVNVITINIPSLSERKDDIPLFVDYFMKLYNKKYKKNIIGVTDKVNKILLNYNWPGNIRELGNIIERAVILSKNGMIDISVLPDHIVGDIARVSDDIFIKVLDDEIKTLPSGNIYKSIITRVEKHLIEHALINSNNKQKDAAEFLGIHRNTLYLKKTELKI